MRTLPWWPQHWSAASFLSQEVRGLLDSIRSYPASALAALHERCCIKAVFVSCQLEQTLPPTLQESDVRDHLRAVYAAALRAGTGTGVDAVERLLLSLPTASPSWMGDPKEPRSCHLAQLEQHLKALLYLCVVCKGRPLTSEVLKRAHYILMRGARDPNEGCVPARGGQYRNHGSCLGTGHIFPDPDSIGRGVENALALYRNSSDLPYLHRCAFLFYSVVSIHPFSDGNGRLCRLLVDHCLVTQGFPFPIPVAGTSKRTRKHFFHVIEHADKSKGMDLSLLSAYLLECVYHRLSTLEQSECTPCSQLGGTTHTESPSRRESTCPSESQTSLASKPVLTSSRTGTFSSATNPPTAYMVIGVDDT